VTTDSPQKKDVDAKSLKDRVRNFWNQHVCGSGYGVSSEGAVVDFGKITETRYALEPYILELADFASGRGKRVLEIGVGAGTDFESWIKHGAHATGIDLTNAAVELTKKRLAEHGIAETAYTLSPGDAENLGFEDDSFDIVYSYGVLHHTPDTERAFREVFRVLAGGGVFRGMVYHVPSIVGWLLWIRYCLLRGRVFKTPRQAIFEHLESPGTKAYPTDEMRQILQKIGFVDIDVRPKLSFGDLLMQARSTKYRSWAYALVWSLYPRWLIRLLGDRFGNALLIVARKG
jgi:ubiquinone/menaquinone biosynthesis C-methylase UbiE